MHDEKLPKSDDFLLLTNAMNGIHRKIKHTRLVRELTQADIADRMAVSLKTYQNFENGLTKLDVDRLKQVAEILNVSVDDLINAEDNGVFIAEIKENQGGNNGNITIHEASKTYELFEKVIAGKDEQIRLLTETNALLQKLVSELGK